ncbi:MAG: hypothetical protein ACREQZ_03425, partial [Woeseiaceae bacterium]
VWERRGTPAHLEMRFDVGPEPAATYHVTISRADETAASPAVDLVVPTASDGEVMLAVDGAVLKPGNYEIRLEPRPATELTEAVTYTLAVN